MAYCIPATSLNLTLIYFIDVIEDFDVFPDNLEINLSGDVILNIAINIANGIKTTRKLLAVIIDCITFSYFFVV